MQHKQFLPAIHGAGVQGQSDNALTFISAWMLALGERAEIMQRDARLTRCAQDHASFLASREDMEPSMHIGKGGSTPNQRLIASGYKPPSFWKPERNNCEACSVHHDGPIDALIMLLDSPDHRPLVLGERVNDWFWHLHTVWALGNAGPFYVYVAAPEEVG